MERIPNGRYTKEFRKEAVAVGGMLSAVGCRGSMISVS